MFVSYLYLSLVFLLFSSSWTSTVGNRGSWSWTNTKFLTRSNWTSSLKPNTNSSKINHPVWFVFYYLNYCGLCKTAKPAWEATAQYAASWSKYVKVGTYDCNSESTSENDICQDDAYPQWRIFCPLTNSTHLAFDATRKTADTKPEDILMWLIRKLNKIAHDCYGKSWPIRDAIKPKDLNDLNNIIPKRIKKFQLFVSDDILLYSLYVLNNSKTVSQKPVYRLATTNSITSGLGIWKGVRNPEEQITIEPTNSTKTTDAFILNEHTAEYNDQSSEHQVGTLKPTLNDIDSAVIWMINKDLLRKLPALFEDAKSWLNALHTYYPGSETMNRFLQDLLEFMNNRTTLSSQEFRNYVRSTSTVKLPDIKFDHCNGSDTNKRGYPCSLWVLFHSMTVKQAILAEQNRLSTNMKPTDVIISIRDFIKKFFLCEECAKHFLHMTSNAENEIKSYKDSVLYLWRGHNIVNKRLRDEVISNDPAWPKVPFPTKTQCSSCVHQVDENNDALEYNENETYNYLKDYYNLQNLSHSTHSSSKTNMAAIIQYSHLLLLLSFLFLSTLFVKF